MKKSNRFGNTAIVLGMLVASSSFAADAVTTITQTKDQKAEMIQKREQKRDPQAAQEGDAKMHQHREMHQERVKGNDMRGAGSTSTR